MAHKAKKIIRKLSKKGKYTYYIVLPADMVAKLHWKERQRLELSRRGKKIIIEDA